MKERLWVAMALDHPLVNLGTTVRLEELGGQTFMTLGLLLLRPRGLALP